MSRRLVIITEIISPYRIPLFNALSKHAGVDLHVIFLAETDPVLRQWEIYKDEITFRYQVLRSWRLHSFGYKVLLNAGILSALSKARPDIIVCGGYNYVASWQALFWARMHKIPFLLWSESNSQDMRPGHTIVELLKRNFLGKCSAFVVPGQAAAEYLLALGIREEIIFKAVNAVDNDLFASATTRAQAAADEVRAALHLPARYFIFAGRLVREKGVFELLSAYAKLDRFIRENVGLVFVGDGVCRRALEEQASSVSPGTVQFAGFAQREQLANYYALADILVLPTYSDTWGLVVNEGMACGLPVILSRAAGCGAELVTDNWNGRIVPPRDVESLAAAMQDLITQPELISAMRANSLQRIAGYSANEWSAGMIRMMNAVEAVLD